MSFGFSIGDISMLAQLSYKLYGMLGPDRESAPATLRELAKSLFGLQCTLGHLKDLLLSAKFSSSATPSMQANFSLLIENCLETLKRLEAILEGYEEKVVVKPKDTRGKVVREWHRVKWAVEEKGLADIRAKIVQQTEGITLVLNIFTWTEVREGRKEVMAKIEELLEKLSRHGPDAKQAAQDAEQMMKDLVARTMGGVTSDLKDMIISTIKLAVSPPPHPSPSPPPHGRGFQAFKMGSAQCAPAVWESTKDFGMTGIEAINRDRAAVVKPRPIHMLRSSDQHTESAKLRSTHRIPGRPPAMQPEREPPVEDPSRPPRPPFPVMALASSQRQPIPVISPSQWLAKCETTMQLWAATPASTVEQTTKMRTGTAVGLLDDLHACLGGLGSKEVRRRYRARLEGERFDLVLRQMKVFCKGSVVLRKLVDTYEADKEDDEMG